MTYAWLGRLPIVACGVPVRRSTVGGWSAGGASLIRDPGGTEWKGSFVYKSVEAPSSGLDSLSSSIGLEQL